MKENWAKELSEHMDGFERPVDDAVWERIARETAPSPRPWWPIYAVVGFAAAGLAAVLLLLPLAREQAFDAAAALAIDESPEAPSPQIVIPENLPPVSISRGETKHRPVSAEGPGELALRDDGEQNVAADVEYAVRLNEEQNDVADGEFAVLTDEKEAAPEEAPVSIITLEQASKPDPKPHKLAFSTSFYAQTSPIGTRFSTGSNHPWNNTSPLYGKIITMPTPTNPIVGNPENPGTVGGNGGDCDDEPDTKASGLSSSYTTPDLVHSFPIQAGARVSVRWSEHWSLDSGLSFIHFLSWGDGFKQRMEYLGVPLYINYTMGAFRHFSAYASAGGQALKCFAGNSPDKPWLFSAGFGLGAEYHLSNTLGLFVEPCADWYFHTGESRNYYTANPFAFSFTVGLRFSL